MVSRTTYGFVKKLGYNSILGYININDNGTINHDNLNNVLGHMFEYGWKEIDLKDVELIPPSTQMRYLIKDDDGIKFRTGGFFISYYSKDDDPELTDSYILYASHMKGVNVSAQISSLYKVYIKLKKTKNNVVRDSNKVYYKHPVRHTNYPVCIVGSDGNTYVVYYARSIKERNDFMNTKKYKKALRTGWAFIED